MTLRDLLEYGKSQLKNAGVLEYEIDAWYLMEYICRIDRTHYLLDSLKEVSKEQQEEYTKYIQKRMTRIPLQYITGVQEFMGLEFKVNEHVLIPRQDTEVLVETVGQCLEKDMNILDMCTGSGCILISLLHQFEMRTGLKLDGVGVDISKMALETARDNAKNLNVECCFVESDLFEKVKGSFDIIVSNPPYIPTRVIEELMPEVKSFEPMSALDGMEDGLFFYRKIISQGPGYLKNLGRLFFEIGHDQGIAVSKLMEQAGFCEVSIIKDLAGLDRVVCGKYESC